MALTKIKTGSVSDSITLTTPDINGGTIDATVIGGNTAAAGTFTDVVAARLTLMSWTLMVLWIWRVHWLLVLR